VAQSKGYVVPSGYRDVAAGSDANGYKVHETWVTILVAAKFVDAPQAGPGAPSAVPSVFQCPSGLMEFLVESSITSGMPPTRKSAEGAKGTQHTSKYLEPGRIVYCWYGLNGTSSPTNPSNPGDIQNWIPCRRWPPDGKTTGKLTKITEIKKPSELVFIYDGVGSVNYFSTNANRINARHNKEKQTNILFFDGHAETTYTKTLPGGDGNAGIPATNVFTLANLKNHPRPLWRMDQ
jgi:prepilin-type processing-associated H-X9-DG protein